MRKYFTLLIFTSILLLNASIEINAETQEEEEVSPNEDLMREHGALNRLLLIYEEIANRIDNEEKFPMRALENSALLVRDFVENYHEKLEENYIFPQFEKANLHLDLVKTLKDQHQAGRNLTNYILSHASEKELKDDIQKIILTGYLRLFIRMYRPHEAREDTILFPAFKKLISRSEYEKLGDIFEEKERELFGKEGFEGIINQISHIEKSLDIYNLDNYTPKLKLSK